MFSIIILWKYDIKLVQMRKKHKIEKLKNNYFRKIKLHNCEKKIIKNNKKVLKF